MPKRRFSNLYVLCFTILFIVLIEKHKVFIGHYYCEQTHYFIWVLVRKADQWRRGLWQTVEKPVTSGGGGEHLPHCLHQQLHQLCKISIIADMLLSKCEGRGVGPAAEPGQHSSQDSLPPHQPPSQHLHTQQWWCSLQYHGVGSAELGSEDWPLAQVNPNTLHLTDTPPLCLQTDQHKDPLPTWPREYDQVI